MVLRYERQRLPNVAAIPILVREIERSVDDAQRRGIKIKGVQLDIDCPTNSLAGYGEFLHEFRKTLPQEMKVSITALLDWFRKNTAVGRVITEVDEFVPQFYDIGQNDAEPPAIETKIDPAEWAPKFNSFGVPFRIGISVFGRANEISAPLRADGAVYPKVGFAFTGVAPWMIGVNPNFGLSRDTNPAGELVLTYRALRPTKVSYSDFDTGDGLRFILPTDASVRTAYASAQRMGDYSKGVLFFSWATRNQYLALPPRKVLAAVGLTAQAQTVPVSVRVEDGECVAVNCADLLIDNIDARQEQTVRYQISSSKPFEYFLPDADGPARTTSSTTIEFNVPAFPGVNYLKLGRVVTESAARFSIEVKP